MEQGIATRYQAPQRADLNPCSQTCPSRRSMSAFGGKADIGRCIVPIISDAFDAVDGAHSAASKCHRVVTSKRTT